MPSQYTLCITKKCEACDAPMLVKPSRVARTRFCSRPCHTAAVAARRITVICRRCGIPFTVHPARAAAIYCGSDCHKRGLTITVACSQCGKAISRKPSEIAKGRKPYCGLTCRDAGVTTHGNTRSGIKSAEYGIWLGIKSRCRNPNNSEYRNYGGRGIAMSDAWADSFALFLADAGERPSPAYSIDRIDNSGNYEAGNVRWATRSEQNSHKRTNRLVTYGSETHCLSEWASLLGIQRHVLQHRLDRGWSIDRAFETPVAFTSRSRVTCQPSASTSAAI